TVEAQLSPSVTSRVPHGSKGYRTAPARWRMTRRRVASLAAEAALRCRSTRATNGTGLTCRPSRHNRLPMVLVKVLLDDSTAGVGGQTGLRAASAAPCLAATRFIPPVHGWVFADSLYKSTACAGSPGIDDSRPAGIRAGGRQA